MTCGTSYKFSVQKSTKEQKKTYYTCRLAETGQGKYHDTRPEHSARAHRVCAHLSVRHLDPGVGYRVARL